MKKKDLLQENVPQIFSKLQGPHFMRWGNNGEIISQDANELVQMLNSKIKNEEKYINFIDGANHSFKNYEDVLAKQIVNFVKKSSHENFLDGLRQYYYVSWCVYPGFLGRV